MKKLSLLALCFTSIFLTKAQTYITIGQNTNPSNQNENAQLIPSTFQNAKVQVLIKNAELTSAGLSAGNIITGIQWLVNNDKTASVNTFDVYLDDDFTSSILPSGGVFANPPSNTVGTNIRDTGIYTGWHTIQFTTPFTWDGTDNMLIQTCRSDGGQSVSDVISTYEPGTVGANLMVSGYNHLCGSTTGFYTKDQRPYLRLIVSGTTERKEPVIPQPIRVYPTISSGLFHVQTENFVNFYVYDLIGNKLYSIEMNTTANTIDLSSFSNGLYFIKVVDIVTKNQSTILVVKEAGQ